MSVSTANATLNCCDAGPLLAQMSIAMTTDLISASVTAAVVAVLLVTFKLRSRADRSTD